MAERAFYAGRYSAVCCGGYSAPRLGGMWTGAWGAAWAGDWTTDANVNLQAAVMNIGNLPNSIDGYINFLLRLVDDWEGNAAAIYGMENALMAPPRTDSDRSTIYHYDNINPFEYWNAGSSWLLVPVYESYLCYGDRYISLAEDIDVSALKDVLDLSNKRVKEIESSRKIRLTDEILLPLLTKTANFWEQLVDPRYYEDKDGNIRFDADKKSLNDGERYLILPSNSPENWTLGEYSSSLAINTTMDISAARYELEMACEIMELLKPKGYKDYIAKWTKLSEQLPAYKYDETGALREWAVGSYTENHAHRHISHTYAAWPAHESQSDAELQEGIATAITLRKATAGDKSSGHGWLHTALVDARQKNADGVSEALHMLLGQSAYYTSFMTNHNIYGDSSYVTDILNTVPAVILEALCYSNSGVIEVLPALPYEWTKGSIEGIRARTQADVSIDWNTEKNTVNVTVKSDIDQTVSLGCGIEWTNARVTVNGGSEDYENGDIQIVLKAGETAVITFSTKDYISASAEFAKEIEAGSYTKLTGEIIGRVEGQWESKDGPEKALDSNPATAYDGQNGGYAGYKLDEPTKLVGIKYIARVSNESRMSGVQIQGSMDGEKWDTLYTITSAPVNPAATCVYVPAETAYLYYRVYSGNSQFCNIAVIEFYGE